MDKWDEQEKKPFSGFIERKDTDHQHHFEKYPDGEMRCVYCRKTRQEIRKSEW